MILDPKPGDRVLVRRYIIDRAAPPGSRYKGLSPHTDRGTILRVDQVGVCTVQLDSGKIATRFGATSTIERLPLLDRMVEDIGP